MDDAAGECFDKTAKLLGLSYPGGPAVEKLAAECTDHARALHQYPLPAPMVGKNNCDFSFSGLKTAVKLTVDKQPDPIPRQAAADICYSFQHSVGLVNNART